MKKIFSLIAILALVAVIFTLAACGDNTQNDMMDDMSSLKNEEASMLEGIDDELTENGNVTDHGSSTGLFEGMTSDNANGGNGGNGGSGNSGSGNANGSNGNGGNSGSGNGGNGGNNESASGASTTTAAGQPATGTSTGAAE